MYRIRRIGRRRPYIHRRYCVPPLIRPPIRGGHLPPGEGIPQMGRYPSASVQPYTPQSVLRTDSSPYTPGALTHKVDAPCTSGEGYLSVPLWIGEKLSTGIEKIVMLTTGGAKFFPQSVWKKAFDLADPRKTGSFSPEVAVEKTVDTVDNSCAEVCAYWGWTSIMSTFFSTSPPPFSALSLYFLPRALV